MSSPEEIFDPIGRPKHYNKKGIEAIDVIEAFAGNKYLRGNALKYVLRADYKGDTLKDLKKAVWYLQREIAQMEKLEAHVTKVADRALAACPDTDDLWCNPPEWKAEDHQNERIVPKFDTASRARSPWATL